MTAGGNTPRRSRPLRAVLLAGITTGTALLTGACWEGWRPRIPALPSPAGLLAGAIVAWLVFTAAASVAAGLLARHYRALARHAARGTRRASLAAARAAGKGSRNAGGRLAARAAGRWQARGQAAPLMFHRPVTGQPCSHCGGPGGPGNDHAPDCPARAVPVIPLDDVIPGPGENKPSAPAPGPADPWGGDRPMTTPPAPPPAPRARRPASRASTPGAWKALVAATEGFEPEDDAQLLEWMAAEVAGVSAYAEALTEVYETCVNSLGVDPAAMNAVHDTADAAADAATAMAYARQKFAAHYAEVREFAASGGLLPFDGRWITGDGDT